MSLLSLSKSLGKIFSYCHTIPDQEDYKSTKIVKKLEFLIKTSTSYSSLNLIKKIGYICNYKFKNEGYLRLNIAEKLLQN